MYKKYIPFSFLMALSFSQAAAFDDEFFQRFEKMVKSMQETVTGLEQRTSAGMNVELLDDKLQILVKVPEEVPTDKMKLDISENRSFKVKLHDNDNVLLVQGALNRGLLTLSEQCRIQKEGRYNRSSNSYSHTIMGKLNFRDIEVEYDEDEKKLRICVPKEPDPDNQSKTVDLPRRKK